MTNEHEGSVTPDPVVDLPDPSAIAHAAPAATEAVAVDSEVGPAEAVVETPEPDAAPEVTDGDAPAATQAAADAPDAEQPAEEPEPVVEPLTAADIPALEGCDVEKSWSGDETCEGTEAVAETLTPEQAAAGAAAAGVAVAGATEVAEGAQAAPAEAEAEEAAAVVVDPEAESGLEAAEGELEAAQIAVETEAELHATPTWPFIAYLVLWAALCGLAGWQLSQVPAGQGIYESDIYRYTVLGGIIMTAVGPVLIFVVWLATWLRAGDGPKTGLLASSLLKGSIVTLFGVIMWWGMFLIVDQLRLGRFY